MDALRPVPLGRVTLSSCTMSPAFAPCALVVVIVTLADVFVVAIVDDVKELLIGVMSNS